MKNVNPTHVQLSEGIQAGGYQPCFKSWLILDPTFWVMAMLVVILTYNIMPRVQNMISLEKQEYQVQSILGRKCSKTGLMYLIKWKNFPLSQATWEPVNNLCNSIQIVKEYERSKNTEGNQYTLGVEQAEEPKSRRKFKEHLVFPKSLKRQIHKQLQAPQNKTKPIQKQKKGDKYISSSQKDWQIEENFWIVISPSEQSQKQQSPEPHAQAVMEDANSERNLTYRSGSAISSQRENQLLPASLNLSELEDEENERLTLQNLNPDAEVPVSISKLQKSRFTRISNPEGEIKMIEADEPKLNSSELKIVKFAKMKSRWLARVSLDEQSLGYIEAQVLQQKNSKVMLDYLFDLLQA